MRFHALVVGLTAFAFPVAADEATQGDARTPEQQVKARVDQYEAAYRSFVNVMSAARTVEEQQAATKLRPDLYGLGATLMTVAREHPGTTAAEDALVWVASHVPNGPDGEDARVRLARDHVRSARLAPALGINPTFTFISPGTESLLRGALGQNPQREVQGMAAFWLARNLKVRAESARFHKTVDVGAYPEEKRRVLEITRGKDWAERLHNADPEALDREAESLFTRVVKEFGDIPVKEGRYRVKTVTLRDQASAYVHEYEGLSPGKPAPDAEGTDLEGKPFRLKDYRGKVVLLEFGSHFFSGTCHLLYPRLQALVKTNEGKPFAVVSIEVGRDGDPQADREALKKARAEEALDWRCVWDGNWDGPLNVAWNVRRFPTVYVIDRAGVIRFKDPNPETLDGLVAKLLAEPEARQAR